MIGERSDRRTMMALTVCAVLAGTASAAAAWTPVEPMTPQIQTPAASGIWVQYAPSLSVDCSPPRGCYAATQYIFYSVDCVHRYAAMVERISLDLNGTILKHESFSPYVLSDDETAVQTLKTVCPVRRYSNRE